MAKYECPVCHGISIDPQAEGVTFFHACPPLSGPELAAMPAAQARELAPELPAAFTRADIDRVLGARSIERPGARNENIAPGQPPVNLKPGETPDPSAAKRIQDQPPRIKVGD